MTKLFATDIHGTIVDSNLGAQKAINVALEELGKKERVSFRFVRETIGLPWGDCYRKLFPIASEEEVRRFVSVLDELAGVHIPKHEKLMEHAYEVLTEVRRRSYQIAVISIMERKGIVSTLDRHGILHLVDPNGLLGIEHEQKTGGYDVGGYKGKLLRRYIESRGFDRSVMLGDREEDMIGGRIAGAMPIYFNREGRKSPNAEYSIRDLLEVLAIV